MMITLTNKFSGKSTKMRAKTSQAGITYVSKRQYLAAMNRIETGYARIETDISYTVYANDGSVIAIHNTTAS